MPYKCISVPPFSEEAWFLILPRGEHAHNGSCGRARGANSRETHRWQDPYDIKRNSVYRLILVLSSP